MFLSSSKNFCLFPKLYSFVRQARSLRPIVKLGKEKFQISIDVRQFQKDEIRVKAIPEYVVVEGKLERKTKNGQVVRQFIRKFKLPDGCNPSTMRSVLSADGILTITAPRKICDSNLPCETLIPISCSLTSKKSDESLISVEETKRKNEDKSKK